MKNAYLDELIRILEEIKQQEQQSIETTVQLMTDAILEKRSIYVFGCSHAAMLAEELYYRAGGLMLINPIFSEPISVYASPISLTSKMENLEGYGTILANKVPIKKDDLVIVHSVSGRNAVCMDFAIEAKKKGAIIVCLTSMQYATAVTSRHSSGKMLHEVSDVIIDNHGELGDSCIKLPGLDQKVGATSTVSGIAIFNEIVVQVTERLMQNGIEEPPIFYSANLDGGTEKNLRIREKYADSIHYAY